MTAKITELISTDDGHEIVTQALGQILAIELANQQALAVADGANSEDWEIAVYTNRMIPFDSRQDEDDLTPIVNVWFNSSTYDKKGSSSRAMRGSGVWNVDLYTFGKSERTVDGHSPGDQSAKDQIDRWMGIIRRVLMSAHYTYLGSPRGAPQWCYGRWVDGINTFQPDLELRSVITALGARMNLGIEYLVDSPQILGELFDLMSTSIFREEDGRLLAKITSAKNGEFQAGFSETFD